MRVARSLVCKKDRKALCKGKPGFQKTETRSNGFRVQPDSNSGYGKRDKTTPPPGTLIAKEFVLD
jgi:hypothetical protein